MNPPVLCRRIIACAAMLLAPSIADAQCIAVVDAATELPRTVVTPNGTALSYSYDLQTEEYLVRWSRDGQSGGPYGPFVLTRACEPARLRWENDDFVLLEAGCGTFCWYAIVLPLVAGTVDTRIERPLAFDASRSLIASYEIKDTIRVANLRTGRVQEIRTARECDSYSGLCFENLRFTDTGLEYTWRYDPAGEKHQAALASSLLVE